MDGWGLIIKDFSPEAPYGVVPLRPFASLITLVTCMYGRLYSSTDRAPRGVLELFAGCASFLLVLGGAGSIPARASPTPRLKHSMLC